MHQLFYTLIFVVHGTHFPVVTMAVTTNQHVPICVMRVDTDFYNTGLVFLGEVNRSVLAWSRAVLHISLATHSSKHRLTGH